MTHGAPSTDRAGTLVSDYGGPGLSGFIANAPGNGATEFISAGIKGHAGNASDLVSRLQFAYWTVEQDPSGGGPCGSVRLGFYEGDTPGGATPTLTLDLTAPMSFADGPIGYSWRFIDSDLGVGTQ